MYKHIRNLIAYAPDTGAGDGDQETGSEDQESSQQDGAQDAQETEQTQIDANALQSEIRALRRENAKWRTQLRKLEETQEAAAQAELSEVERLKVQVTKLEQAAAQAQADAKAQVVRSAATLAATKAGVRADALDIVIALIDPDGLELSDSGDVDGLDEMIQEIVKARPFLAEQSTTKSISPTNPAEGGTGETHDQQLTRLLYPARNTMFGEGGGVVFRDK